MEHTINQKLGKMLVGISILAFMAMCVTAYLVYLHYEPSAAEFCNLGQQFNCDIVNKSQWSYIALGSLEIPVSIFGFLYYMGIFIGSIGVARKVNFASIHKLLEPMNVIRLMRWFTYIGVLFTLYLTYIEAFVLHTFCLFCVIQQVLILGILGLFIAMKRSGKKKDKKACCCAE
jgi:uncharacterized membrane protein